MTKKRKKEKIEGEDCGEVAGRCLDAAAKTKSKKKTSVQGTEVHLNSVFGIVELLVQFVIGKHLVGCLGNSVGDGLAPERFGHQRAVIFVRDKAHFQQERG